MVVLDPVPEDGVVIVATADVDDEVVVMVFFIEVAGDVLDIVPVGLLDEVGGGEGHGNDSIGDVGEVQLFTLVAGGSFGSGHYLSHNANHSYCYVISNFMGKQKCNAHLRYPKAGCYSELSHTTMIVDTSILCLTYLIYSY